MESGAILEGAMVIAGIVVMMCSFWLLAVKRMTADLAVIWEIAGVILIVIGSIYRIAGWEIHEKQEMPVLCIGVVSLFFCYQFSLHISRLQMRNQELAIEVSMLLPEKEGKEKQHQKELLLILPVRNEEKNLQKVLEKLQQSEIREIADILCINDASSDASGQIIDSFQCEQITNVYGLGYGSALQLGYKYAVRNHYRFVIQMDADGQHDVCNIPLIYQKLQERDRNGNLPDLVLASRFMEGSLEFSVSVWKKAAFGLFRSMIRVVTGRRIADPTTGLQGLNRKAFTYYSMYNNFDYQYPDANMVMQMLLLGFHIAEVPAVMHARTDGKSMHSGLEPIGYMLRMFLSVLAVVFRIKVLHRDRYSLVEKRMNRTDRKRFFKVLLAVLIVALPLCVVILNQYQGNVRMENYKFRESARELRNPGRGFYNLYRFMITDEKVNYWQVVQEMYKGDTNTSLSLVEINLQNYRGGEISEAGIKNVQGLFQALEDIDKQLIVRFMYDWDGENEKYEPDTIDIILRHMEQLEDILRKENGQIFVLQGLFIGNWGEMNSTKYSEYSDLIQLAAKLNSVTHPDVYLAVRTPLQWRQITGLQAPSEEALRDHFLAGRISLYNDGMLGNKGDYGTYQVYETPGQNTPEREEELAFQEKLCRQVPNGGEVINDNYYNDFENAVKDLATMHVTYLNEGHDREVLDKWKDAVVNEEGCFKGMDGYTYIGRHLGYRLLIRKAEFHYNTFMDHVETGVTMQNVGFAPLYFNPKAELILYDKEQAKSLRYEMSGDLRSLSGGNERQQSMTLRANIPLDELQNVKYEAYFSLTDSRTGERILLANEQDAETYGYGIGTIEVSER